jgi:pyruvate formate lyase activating enzyme
MSPRIPTRNPRVAPTGRKAPVREALFWEPAAGGKVRCTLCPHLCAVGENEEGICKARGVRNGRLVALTYGTPATIVSDEIEKKSLFHFYPGTRALSLGGHGCNVLCGGCPNWQISHASPRTETARLPVLLPEDAVAMAHKHKLAGVAFTYNEPVVWIEYVRDVSAAFREAGLYTAVVTASFLNEEALDYVAPYVDAFRYDLKAPDDGGWAKLSRVKDAEQTLAMAARAKEAHGCHVEVASNIVPELNDDDASMAAMARLVVDRLGAGTPWHVTRFLPEFELSYLPPTPIKTLERGLELGKKAGLRFVYIGNVPGHPARDTICPRCSRTAIHRGEPKVEIRNVKQGLCATCGEDLGLVGLED